MPLTVHRQYTSPYRIVAARRREVLEKVERTITAITTWRPVLIACFRLSPSPYYLMAPPSGPHSLWRRRRERRTAHQPGRGGHRT